MLVKQLRPDLVLFLKKRNLKKKFERLVVKFIQNPHHSSLNTKILEPKSLRIYSFRVDKKYRAIFVFLAPNLMEIIDTNNHYSL